MKLIFDLGVGKTLENGPNSDFPIIAQLIISIPQFIIYIYFLHDVSNIVTICAIKTLHGVSIEYFTCVYFFFTPLAP